MTRLHIAILAISVLNFAQILPAQICEAKEETKDTTIDKSQATKELFEAIAKGDLKKVKELALVSDLNTRNKHNYTPIEVAAFKVRFGGKGGKLKNNLAILRALKDAGSPEVGNIF